MKPRSSALNVLLLCVFLFSGCGYQLGRPGHLPVGIAKVRIPPVHNPTNETELSTILTNDLINEFIKNGYVVTLDKNESDAGLTGRIVTMRTRTVSRVGDHTALERRVEISTNFELTDRNGKVLWRATEISDGETYAVSADENTSEAARRTAISTLSERLSEKIFNMLAD